MRTKEEIKLDAEKLIRYVYGRNSITTFKQLAASSGMTVSMVRKSLVSTQNLELVKLELERNRQIKRCGRNAIELNIFQSGYMVKNVDWGRAWGILCDGRIKTNVTANCYKVKPNDKVVLITRSHKRGVIVRLIRVVYPENQIGVLQYETFFSDSQRIKVPVRIFGVYKDDVERYVTSFRNVQKNFN